MRNKSELSIARQVIDEIEEKTEEYVKVGYKYEVAKTKADTEVKEKYKEFDTRVVEKAEGS